MAGWIPLPRDIENHWLWLDPRRLRMWIKLLFLAEWNDKCIVIGNTQIDIKRGQLATTLSQLSSQLGCTKKTTLAFLSILESSEMIEKETAPKYTLITIKNYDVMYEGISIKDRSPSVHQGAYSESKLHRNLHPIKEYKNIESKISSSSSPREKLEKIFKNIREEEEFWRDMQKCLGCSVDFLKSKAEFFFSEQLVKGTEHADLNEIKTHLLNWLRRHIEINQKNNNPKKATDNGKSNIDRRHGIEAPDPRPEEAVKGYF